MTVLWVRPGQAEDSPQCLPSQVHLPALLDILRPQSAGTYAEGFWSKWSAQVYRGNFLLISCHSVALPKMGGEDSAGSLIKPCR